MRLPQAADVITLTEDLSTKIFDSKWTPKIIGVMAVGAFGFLLGVEAVRAAIG